jgi:hypothetical protein
MFLKKHTSNYHTYGQPGALVIAKNSIVKQKLKHIGSKEKIKSETIKLLQLQFR